MHTFHAKNIQGNGPTISDLISEWKWEGVQKIVIKSEYQGRTGVIRGGMGSKNWKTEMKLFLADP